MIVVDTNVISEAMRQRPNARVVAWLDAQPVGSLFTSALTQAEVLVGLALLPESRRRRDLVAAVEAVFAEDFAGRVLSFDSTAAHAFAAIVVNRQRRGRPLAQIDAQIAAIAAAHGASVATRNVADFEGCGVRVVNPWEA